MMYSRSWGSTIPEFSGVSPKIYISPKKIWLSESRLSPYHGVNPGDYH